MKPRHVYFLVYIYTHSLLTSWVFAQSAAPPQPPESLSDEIEALEFAPLNPDFIAWREEQRTRRLGLEAQESMPSGIIPSPFDDRYLRRVKSSITLYAELPSQYDLRTYGYVTPVKDQGACGACWAFATYSSLESCLLKTYGETWDFSENHLKNYHGYDMLGCEGGDWKKSTAYLTRWSGPIAEADDPFHDYNEPSSPGGPTIKYVVNVLAFYSAEDIKNAVMTYGALYTAMKWDPDYYNSSSRTYYYTGDEDIDHGVAIIGWDNDKYVPGAPHRGAWLVKNSWGESEEHAPYLYVSYDDKKAVDDAVAFCDAVPTSSYLHNYQYDELGLVHHVGSITGSTICWGANVFTAITDEELAAVGFYALSPNTTYEVTVYDTIDLTGDYASFSDECTKISGTARWFGYYTVNLPSTVPLSQGDDFAIVIKFSTPETTRPLPVEYPVEGYSSAAEANAGEGYFSTNGQSFQDITTLEGGEEVSICIKGLTVAPGSKMVLPPDLEAVASAQYASLENLASGSEEAQRSQRLAVQQLALPLEVKTRQTGIAFRLIPAGTFIMGSPPSEPYRRSDELQHEVTLTKAFYCGTLEVTQALWKQVMGSNPSYHKYVGSDAPVETVSWEDGSVFLTNLCRLENVPNGTYRLLTEAEWEYACRGGSTSAYCCGDNESDLGEYAWYWDEENFRTHLVGQKKPNAFGLFDMHGNVSEWCQDAYGDYPSGSVTDPIGPPSGVDRVRRGGSGLSRASYCRSAHRDRNSPSGGYIGVGLRIARTLNTEPSSEVASIVGTWNLNTLWDDEPPLSRGPRLSDTISFSPDGTFMMNHGGGGTWYQVGDFVTWTYPNGTEFTGTLSSPAEMSGTMVSGVDDSTGKWWAWR